MKKLSQNKRIIIVVTVSPIMTILGSIYIGIRHEIEIDMILIFLLLGFVNGYLIMDALKYWNPSIKEKS